MTETAAAATATPKVKKAAKAKKPSSHPVYSEMVKKAITDLGGKSGSSRQAIVKYILKNFKLEANDKSVTIQTKMALKRGVASGLLKQSKGTGASGSFKIGVTKKEEKKPKAKKTTKTKVKKPKTPKKPAKKSASKVKKVKKPKAAKPRKVSKPTKKPTAKKVAKPKKAKTTKKAAKK